MDRYETAKLEITAIDEDVITASESSNSTNSTMGREFESCVFDHSYESWIVTYTDGTTERYQFDYYATNYGKPDVCD